MTTGTGSIPNSPESEAAGSTRSVHIEVGGNVEGSIVTGDNNIINNYHTEHGNIINYHTRPAVKPRDMKPQPPRAPRGFVGRDAELKKLEKHIQAREPVLLHGPDGIGKTALIKKAASSDAGSALPDGVLIPEVNDSPALPLGYQDILQLLFDALFESDPPLKAEPTTVRTYLSNTSPLVILDQFDVQLSALEKLTDMFPSGAIVATSRSSLVGEVYDSIEILPLKRVDSVELLATKSGIENNSTNYPILSEICELLGDVPLTIIKTANVIREKRVDPGSIVGSLRNVHPPSSDRIQSATERSYGFIFQHLNENERKMLAQAAAGPGKSVDRPWLEEVAGGEQTSNALENLELLQTNSPRLRVADGYKEVIISNTRNIETLRETLLEYLLDGLKLKSLDFDFVRDELGNILGVIQWAANRQRWSNVVELGRAVDVYLTLNGLWDAWEVVLQLVLQAGKSLTNSAAEAWALHQLGSREACVGSIPLARKYLIHALRIRESLGDDAGAAHTRHNLHIVFTLRKPPKKPLIERIISAIGRFFRINPWILIPFLLILGAIIAALFLPPLPKSDCPMPQGWQNYRVQEGDTFDSISRRVGSTLDIEEKEIPILKLAIQNANSNCNTDEKPSADSTTLPTILPTKIPVHVPGVPVTLTVSPKAGSEPETASILLDLSIQPGTFTEPGQLVIYTYVARNAGDDTLAGPLSLTATNGMAINCPNINSTGNLDDNLDPDERILCSSIHKITQADLDRGQINSSVVANIGGITSNQVTSTVPLTQMPGITIRKAADPVFYSQAGEEITYSYAVINTGNVTLSPIQIYVKDEFSNGAEEDILCGPDPADLAPGDTVTCTTSYKTTQNDIALGSVMNQASVSIHAYGYNLMDNRSAGFMGDQSATAAIYYARPLILKKTADHETYESVGQVITYTYAITNANNPPIPGPITVQDDMVEVSCPDLKPSTPTPTQPTPLEPTTTATATDTPNPTTAIPLFADATSTSTPVVELLPSATATQYKSIPVDELGGKLKTNETIYCEGTYIITQKDLDFGSLTNEAVAHVGEVESDPATLTLKADQRRGIDFTKSAEPATFDHVGQAITYTYTIFNTGNVTLQGKLTINDNRINGNTPFDCGSDLNDFHPNDTVTCSAIYNVTSADLVSRSVTNNATAVLGSLVSSASATITCPYPQPGWVPYTILAGDTLSRISALYTNLGVAVIDLQRKNCKPGTELGAGEILYVPRPPTGNISGYVFTDLDRDSKWNPTIDNGISGVDVTVLNLDTQVTYTTTTNSAGFYMFSGLPPGSYRVFQFPSPELLLNAGETIVDRNFAVIPAE